jgi:nicotinamide-nucleotide adenylyltransferase
MKLKIQAKALYIGRFQPFHLGHLDAINQILKQEDFLIIAIGSAQYSHTKENPFTAKERQKMIIATLKFAKINPKKYKVILIPNIENFDAWPNHVDSLVPKYENIYTGSKLVKSLFKAQKRHTIKSIKFNKKISATLVREKIAQNKKWENLVPKSVAEFIKTIDGETRIKETYGDL